jgi:uncharacterized membrane protein (DUF4010 family)
MQPSFDILIKIGYALGIGVLIGLERSMIPPSNPPNTHQTDRIHTRDTNSNTDDVFLGVRTYSILSLCGFSAALMGTFHPAITPVIVGGVIVLIIALYIRTPNMDPGITTEISAIACCGLGLLCFWEPYIAGVLALIITVLLALKRFMERTIKRLHRIELTDTLKFLAIILIILPLLPNRTLDPYKAFNPHKIMLLVILISGIGFVGYFLTKFFGAQKGLGLTGFLGGLTSSTAVTAAMSSQAKTEPGLGRPCTFAVILANATMFGRVLVVVALLDWRLLLKLVWSIGAMTIFALLAAALLWLKMGKKKEVEQESSERLILKNPFSLGPAIKFSIFFVIILLVAKVAKIYLGDKGIYLASLVSGLADVDAITLSIAQQTKGLSLAHSVGAIGVTIAVVANSIVKSSIAVYSGGWQFGRRVGLILMGATVTGLAVLLII